MCINSSFTNRIIEVAGITIIVITIVFGSPSIPQRDVVWLKQKYVSLIIDTARTSPSLHMNTNTKPFQ